MNLEPEILNLYDSIILIDEPEISVVKESKKIEINENKLRFEGGLDRNLLFVYNLPDNWQGEDEQMIKNLITNALKFQLSDVAFLNLYENKNPELKKITDELNPTHIVFWGCAEYAAANGLNASQYEVHSLSTFKYINADAVNSLHTNKDLKVKLWAGIQSLLQLK